MFENLKHLVTDKARLLAWLAIAVMSGGTATSVLACYRAAKLQTITGVTEEELRRLFTETQNNIYVNISASSTNSAITCGSDLCLDDPNKFNHLHDDLCVGENFKGEIFPLYVKNCSQNFMLYCSNFISDYCYKLDHTYIGPLRWFAMGMIAVIAFGLTATAVSSEVKSRKISSSIRQLGESLSSTLRAGMSKVCGYETEEVQSFAASPAH